jgi:hypothetical protein
MPTSGHRDFLGEEVHGADFDILLSCAYTGLKAFWFAFLSE